MHEANAETTGASASGERCSARASGVGSDEGGSIEEMAEALASAQASLHMEVRRRRNAEDLLWDIVETLPEGIAAFDADERLLVYNSAYLASFTGLGDVIAAGVPFETILRRGVEAGEFVLPNMGGTNREADRETWITQRLEEHRTPNAVSVQQMSGGRWHEVRRLRSRAGYVVGVRTDITALKEAESRIRTQAERDPLTGLFNRTVLIAQLKTQIARHKAEATTGALVVLDLVKFKEVNDTQGHTAGDALLVEVATRLVGAVRSEDGVLRLGGDEFALILPGVGNQDAVERFVSRLKEHLGEPFTLLGRVIRPQATMGVCLFPEHGEDAVELLKFADNALFQAKARERGGHCYFNASLRHGMERRGTIAQALREALETGALDIALQPQFSIADGTHTGFEALARWRGRDPEISPVDFIPVAEETGLIVPLGRHVLDRSLAAARRMWDAGLDPGVVAVNVAAAQLKSLCFVDTVATLLKEHDLPARILEIEVTENVLLGRSSERIERCLRCLQDMGVAIALDDFGTGHASLAHLKRVPVDRLKIDRSFVAGIGERTDDEVIVRTVVSLAHALGKTVVAEGVQTEAQRRFLAELACDVGQGFLVSRPLTPDAAQSYLRDLAGPI
ncbi:putative bifunctional diguanylate cyclase/phosphodiesterase [Breoghania corrubedonensis]|nr:EAL domain-containing protein [Breoghania corrubedonensis]